VSKKLSLGDEDTANYILVEGRGEPCSDIAVYKVKKLQWHDPQHPGDARNPQPQDYNDLKDAQFNRWVDIYTAEDEFGKTSTIGSYGPQRIAIDVGADEFPLRVDSHAQQFSDDDVFDLSNKAIMFIPAGDGISYGACLREISRLPTEPFGGSIVWLGDDNCTLINLTDQKMLSIYGSTFASFYVTSNGYITFSKGDYDGGESFSDHFNTKRISCLFNNFDPSAGGMVTWQQLSDRVVVTWQGIPELGRGNSNTFQVEMYFDGRIQLAWLGVESKEGLVGLSEGLGLPTDFQETNLSAYPACKMEPPDICSYIWTFSGSGISDVTLTFSNGGGSTTTDNSGFYSKTVTYGWSGVVTPSRSGYTFSPPSTSYAAVTSDLSDQNYVGFAVWGDFDADNDVDLADFAMFAERWRRTDSSFRYGGGGADFTDDAYVDFNDLKKLAENWLISNWQDAEYQRTRLSASALRG
jgi:hypothetical protein